MHGLLTGYVMYFNHRHKRVGRLLQNRYKSILCEKDAYFLELIRYIHLNPLRAGVVRSLRELAAYPWSGHSTLLGKRKRAWQNTAEVFAWFGTRKREARRRYYEFVKEGEKEGEKDNLEGGGLCRSAGGWAGVKALKQGRETWQGDERILGEGEFVEQTLEQSKEKMLLKERARRNGWNIDRLALEICWQMGIKPDEIRQKRRDQRPALARSLIAYCAYQEMGVKCLEIAKYLGISGPGVSKMVRRGYRERERIELSY